MWVIKYKNLKYCLHYRIIFSCSVTLLFSWVLLPVTRAWFDWFLSWKTMDILSTFVQRHPLFHPHIPLHSLSSYFFLFCSSRSQSPVLLLDAERKDKMRNLKAGICLGVKGMGWPRGETGGSGEVNHLTQGKPVNLLRFVNLIFPNFIVFLPQ